MKQFSRKIILFILPIIIVTVIFEYGLGTIPNSYNKKRGNLEANLDSIEVLILGNSRSLYAIDPAYFKYKGFNLSNISQTIFYNKELARRYIPKMPKLKCIIIELTPSSFGVDLIDGKEHWRDFYYSQFWGINYPENKWYEIKQYSKFFLYQPLQSCYYASKGFKVNLTPELRPNGWLFVDSANTRQIINDKFGKSRAEFHNSVFRESRYTENLASLAELIALARKHNVTCVLLSSPVYKTYYKYLDMQRLSRGISEIRKLCDIHNCSYVNYLRDERFGPEDYADNDHFNFIGAKKYSKIINDEVLEKYCFEKYE